MFGEPPSGNAGPQKSGRVDCFSECFFNPFESDACDACRASAADPMPEWTTKEKILWSLCGLIVTSGFLWLSAVLNRSSSNNCSSPNAACYNPYYSDPYYYYSDPYNAYNDPYASAVKTRSLKIGAKK